MNPNINTNMASTSTQTEVFEISDPTKTGNSLSNITTGIGNFLDGASNIASLTVTLDSVEKEKAEYNGFTANTGSQSASYTGSNHFLNSVSQADMYTTTTQKGFRLKGQYHLNDIARTNVTSYIGPAKSAPYVLNIAFTRTQPTYSANYTTNVYVDDLSVSPSKDGSNSSDTITVRAVSNCMGIPSVTKFDLLCVRKYDDINSTNGFIRGDTKIANFGTINNVGGDSATNLEISTINNTGSYTYDSVNGYSNGSGKLYHTRDLNSSSSISFNETIYSLYGSTSITNNVNFNHYVDKNSFTTWNGTTFTPSLTLTDIYEVDGTNISYLDSDLRSLSANTYTSHNTVVSAHTLLYINGKFQTNTSSSYPTISNYNWDSVGVNAYSDGTYGVDLTGSSSGTDKYKWIAFKFNQLNTNGGSQSSGQYSFNGTTYDVLKNTDNVKYLSLKSMLVTSELFDSNTISKLVDSTTQDVVGIIQATKVNTTNTVIGYTKESFASGGGEWLIYGTTSRSYGDTISNPGSYSCYVINGNDYGFYISPTAINDDLILYIGLKNTVAL
jgi:hypothetical protein